MPRTCLPAHGSIRVKRPANYNLNSSISREQTDSTVQMSPGHYHRLSSSSKPEVTTAPLVCRACTELSKAYGCREWNETVEIGYREWNMKWSPFQLADAGKSVYAASEQAPLRGWGRKPAVTASSWLQPTSSLNSLQKKSVSLVFVLSMWWIGQMQKSPDSDVGWPPAVYNIEEHCRVCWCTVISLLGVVTGAVGFSMLWPYVVMTTPPPVLKRIWSLFNKFKNVFLGFAQLANRNSDGYYIYEC